MLGLAVLRFGHITLIERLFTSKERKQIALYVPYPSCAVCVYRAQATQASRSSVKCKM
jgi:hypothetical protein